MAADYPDKPITLVVPYSAGGGADSAARVIAPALGNELKQNVVIENKAGASGSIGASYVARSAPDGYTVLFDGSAFIINPVLRKLPYDAERDFIPVSQAISVPNIMVVASSSPFASLNAFIAAARKDPGKYTFASYGPGSLAQMIGELLKKQANVDIVHIPYKGGAPALVDVMGGNVDTYFANAASSLGYITGNKLKALAVTSATRMKELPDVPTMAEAGMKDISVLEENGFFLPTGTPPAIVAKLQLAVQNALKRDEVKEKLDKLGLTPVGSSSTQYAESIKAERKVWVEVVKANRISLE
jgi:tripartite-type tricarboxylate transporter receptor subunit TctC